jgi:hypothetical protein
MAFRRRPLHPNRFSPSSVQEFPSHSPPNSSHSISLLCHSPLRSAKPSSRTEESTAKVTQRHPFLGSPSSAPSLPLSRLHLPHAISSPSSLPSPLPPTSTPMSHIRYHVGPLQGLACSRRPVFSLPPLFLRGRYRHVFVGRGFEDRHCEWSQRAPILCLWSAPSIEGLSHNA